MIPEMPSKEWRLLADDEIVEYGDMFSATNAPGNRMHSQHPYGWSYISLEFCGATGRETAQRIENLRNSSNQPLWQQPIYFATERKDERIVIGKLLKGLK